MENNRRMEEKIIEARIALEKRLDLIMCNDTLGKRFNADYKKMVTSGTKIVIESK